MKMKYLISIFIGLIFIALSGTTNATLIQNGTFDTDLSFWTTFGNNTAVGEEAWVGAPGATEDSYISQNFKIEPGFSTINFSFDYQWVGLDSTNMADIFTATFSYLNSSDSWVSLELVNEKNYDALYGAPVHFDDQVVLPGLSTNYFNANIEFALVESLSTDKGGTRIELDNVIVDAIGEPFITQEAAPVPEPATMVLLGIGLIGLIGVSRKKLN